MINDGTARFLSKREAGISATRSDGSVCTAENDRQAAAAEWFALGLIGLPINDSVTASGDGGHDSACHLCMTFDVVWLGVDREGEPRREGAHLIVNPHEPWRWCDYYLVVSGSIEKGFELVGWLSHGELSAQPQVDFGYGPRMAMPVEKLREPKALHAMLRRRKAVVIQGVNPVRADPERRSAES